MLNNRSFKAFTLVELLAAMMIVAVLMSLSIYGIIQLQIAARDSQRTAKLAEIKGAVDDYYRTRGKYPGMNTNFTWVGSDAVNVGGKVIRLSGPTIRSSNTQTNANQTYYFYSLENDGYRLCARLEVGSWAKFGTSQLQC